jgi:hypothetical protein
MSRLWTLESRTLPVQHGNRSVIIILLTRDADFKYSTLPIRNQSLSPEANYSHATIATEFRRQEFQEISRPHDTGNFLAE